MKKCAICGEVVEDSVNTCPICYAKKFTYEASPVPLDMGNARSLDETTQKTLSDLYAIRAAMSLVAENDDEAEREKREINKVKGEIDRCKRTSSDEKSKTLQNLQQYEVSQNIERLKEERERIEEKYKKAHHDRDINENFLKYKCYFDNSAKVALIVLAIVGAVCGAIVLGILIPGMSNPNWSVDGGLVVAIFFPVTFVWLIVGSFIIVPMVMKKYHNLQRELQTSQVAEQKYGLMLKDINDKLNILRKRQAAGEKYVENSKVRNAMERLQDENEKNDDRIADLQGLIPPHEVAVREIAAKSKAIAESAIQSYPVIDFRDWGNVDLLIYYFETGRAESVKEALQLVDRQRQTDQITQALAMASAEISRTIHQSMAQLGSALAQSFNVLSSQLAAQHSELMQGMEERAARQRAAINEQTAAIERQNAMQVSAQEMNAALLNKISTSSSRLAQQMDRQLREVHHIYQ